MLERIVSLARATHACPHCTRIMWLDRGALAHVRLTKMSPPPAVIFAVLGSEFMSDVGYHLIKVALPRAFDSILGCLAKARNDLLRR